MATTIEQVLENLRKRQSQVIKQEESEEIKPDCPKCDDKNVIIYRVHKDTERIVDAEHKVTKPESMVLEKDFLNGEVCSPTEAWEWRDTYAVPCECVHEKRVQKLMKASEITDAFKRLGFQNYITEGKPAAIVDAYQCALEYYQNFMSIRKNRQNSISLLGQPGAGKTHLLMAISNNLISRKSVPVLYFPFIEGMDDLKDDFDQLEAKLERMKKVELLFIDDLFKPVGKERKPRATEWAIEKMYAVINYRYLNHLPIMVSCELSVDELVDVDEALGTRIFQMCKDYTVVIPRDIKLNHRLEGL
ncbi:ATP-binding protein [Bacillus sp. JJ722]|uniref:ATP-binding protein n=1 Tax=Bacillus sp. JJ722 TaxID=3122973 RepID=UPI003000DFEB